MCVYSFSVAGSVAASISLFVQVVVSGAVPMLSRYRRANSRHPGHASSQLLPVHCWCCRLNQIPQVSFTESQRPHPTTRLHLSCATILLWRLAAAAAAGSDLVVALISLAAAHAYVVLMGVDVYLTCG